MSPRFVINPRTGRRISTEGTVWKRLSEKERKAALAHRHRKAKTPAVSAPSSKRARGSRSDQENENAQEEREEKDVDAENTEEKNKSRQGGTADHAVTEESRIVVTAPHAVCINPFERDCDRVALEAATRLAGKLGPVAELFIGDIYRARGDLNRRLTRRTPFRQQVRAALQGAELLLDIHSFPDPLSFGLLVGQDLVPLVPEVVLLDHPPANTPWINGLLDHLLSNHVTAFALTGSDVNDIVKQALDLQVPAVLIEFYEGLSSERIDEIVTVVAAYFL